MNRQIRLTCLLFLIIFALLASMISLLMRQTGFLRPSNEMRSLDYIFASNARAISFDPSDSDSIVNLGHMEQLVSTLVKQGAGGKFEPYLAESWEKSSDSKVWTFYIRSNLSCDDGEQISPQGFKASLERNLRTYIKQNPTIPVFSNLIGFKDINRTDQLPGIVAQDNRLILNFDRPIKSGLFEFLSMPYYGYYCEGNYDDQNNWLRKDKIISSSAYRIKEHSISSGSVNLEARDDWFSITKESPTFIRLSQMPVEEAFNYKSEAKIIFAYHKPGLEIPKNLTEVKSVPDVLISIVLSPFMKNMFSTKDNRKTFYKRFRDAQLKLKFDDSASEQSLFFYPHLNTQLEMISQNAFSSTSSKRERLKIILTDHLYQIHVDYFKQVLNYVFEGYPVELDIQSVNKSDPHWLDKYRSNTDYDIRVAGVSIGGTPQNWVIEMMFCSKLGIGFPDDSGEICHLVKQFDRGTITSEEYISRFNAILHENQTVIPWFHRRYSWFVSNHIDYSLSPVSAAPRFDLLSFK